MTLPPPRRGPRPLPLHLSLAALTRVAALATAMPACLPASPNWSAAWLRSSARRDAAARIGRQAQASLAARGQAPDAFLWAVHRALAREEAAFLRGVAAYRAHPWRRDLPAPPVAWAEGASRLLAYGGTGPALLVVPSLVNRAEVLDLLPGASLLRHLAAAGTRPLLLDWGAPGEVERGFTLTDYVAGRLERALAAATRLAGGPPIVIGYCMGGLLALAAAERRPDLVRGLALLATPWDFWAGGAGPPRALAALLPALDPVIDTLGVLPVDALQALFAALDPAGIAAKYRGFAALDPDSPRARRFVALEDWLNDGVPLAAAVAREALGGWYGANTPARGAWRIAGAAVDPGAVAAPAFLAIPARDRIVPPDSALALAPLLRAATVHHAAAGHVGMVAGAGAERALWAPLLGWIGAQAVGADARPGGAHSARAPRGRRKPRGPEDQRP